MKENAITRRALVGAFGTTLASAAIGQIPDRTLGKIPSPKAGEDGAPFLNQFFANADTHAVIQGQYTLDSPVKVPHNLRHLEMRDSAELKVRGNHPAVLRHGEVRMREHLTSTLGTGSNEFTVKNGSRYEVGEHILLSGANVVPGSTDRYGYLRKIVRVTATAVHFDRPIPRPITKMPRVSSVKLAPSLRISGTGQIFNEDATQGRTPLVDYFASERPQILGISIHSSGGAGVRIAHCLGGLIDCKIHDLLDDGKQYFGYGVEVSGATRSLTVRGTMTRVRHSVTTSPGPTLDSIGAAGEPEDCLFAPIAVACSDKSVDTHRVGWNTTITPIVSGGHGGVQVRADNTKVIGGSITGSWGPGVAVSSVVREPATISDLIIKDLNASGTAILSYGPSRSTNVTIRNSFGPNIVLSEGCVVKGGSINAGNSIGVHFLGSGNIVENIQLGDSVTTPFLEDKKATNNIFITAPPTDIELLPAPHCISIPTIKGDSRVGGQISSAYGIWDEDGLEYSWSFTRDGEFIKGAVGRTNPRYDVVPADVGTVLAVEVTVTKAGFENGTADGGQTSPVVPAGPIEGKRKPSLSGVPSVGNYLYLDKGAWTPWPEETATAWLVNGKVVAGVTTDAFFLRTADVGKTIAARVTASRQGWLDAVDTTRGVEVGK